MSEKRQHITELGNPRKPHHDEGREMLKGMNQSHKEVTEWALSYIQYGCNDQVLDIGCGGGATLGRMADTMKGGHLTGVDYSKVSVEMSKEYNQEEIQKGRMEVVEASVEEMPFEDNSFDKIVTVESFYFWPNPEENLKEVRRVLKEEGTFLLIADIYQKEGLSKETIENVEKYQMFNPTIEDFEKMFENAGFTKIQIHTKTGTDWICVEGH